MKRSVTRNLKQSTRAFRAALLVTTALTASVCVASPASAGDWIGAIGDWFDPANWSTDVPSEFDDPIISNGGTAQINAPGAISSYVYIGNDADTSGAVEVDGAGTTWDVASDLTVGFFGDGRLDIAGGAVVTSSNTTVALTEGSTGTASVDGEGSVWNAGNFSIGNSGNGTITVANGGVVDASDSSLGFSAGAVGLATVDGAGSVWHGGYFFFIGYEGDGTLDITGGAAVDNTLGYVGYNAGGEGRVTVDGENSIWTNNHDLVVGYAGHGVLDITDGGNVTSGSAYLGYDSTGVGELNVDGEGSLLDVSIDLIIGREGEGGLTVVNGAAVYSDGGVIGYAPGGTGSITVDGEGSLFDVLSFLIVGNDGEGRLTVANGAQVHSGAGNIGEWESGTGSVTVDGEGSSWSQFQLTVGNYGEGRLDIANGGSVTASYGIRLGKEASGTGTVTVDGEGSTLETPDTLEVGIAGEGILDITNGGTVTTDSYVFLGVQTDSTGTVTVDGEGSTLDAAGDLWVGMYGEGILEVANGGVVRNGEGALGVLGSGRATVDGEGSSWINTGRLFVGDSGDGSLEITNGGVVRSSAESVIAQSFDSRGRVTVDGEGSSWIGTSSLDVAIYGDGALEIANGGRVESSEVRVGSHIESTGSVTVDGENSTLEAGAMLTVGLFGDGTLNITNGGTVHADRFRAGGQVDSSGTTLVDGAGSSLIIASSEEVSQFGIFGDAVLTVSNGGLVSIDRTMLVGQTDFSSATINIGAVADEEATAAGTFDVSHIIFGIGDSKIIFNHTDTDFEFASNLSGPATLRLIGSGTTTFTGDSSSFWGTTSVEHGAMFVNGFLGGATTVGAARLGGSGTVSNVTLGNGSLVSPGSSAGTTGTLTVTGDLTFDANSTYEVEVDPAGGGDLIHVTGTAWLNGASVEHVGYSGRYPWYLSRTILTADGGVDGTFGSVTSDYAFLTPSLSYDAQNVYLSLLRNNIDFTEVTRSPNQSGVAGALNGFAPGNPIYDEIIVMTEEEARAAFDALSGEAYASGSAASLQAVQQIRDLLQARLQMFSGAAVASADFVPAAGDAVAGDAPAVWGQLFSARGDNDATATSAAIDRRSTGFIGGVDVPVGKVSRVGVALGYSRSDFDVSARASSGEADNVHLVGYAGTEIGFLDIDATAGYSYGRAQAERTVVVGLVTNNLSADYDTHTFQASLEAGTDIGAGPVTLTPFAGLGVTYVHTDSFTETGGPAALSFASSDNTTGTSSLGLRVGHQAGEVELTGSAAWRHTFGDVEPASRAAFASAPAASFSVRGAPVAEDALALGGDIALGVSERATLTLGYAGEYSSESRDHGLRAEVRIEF